MSCFRAFTSARYGVPLVLAAILGLSGPASGKGRPGGPNPQAVAAFEEGQERFSNADYEGALAAFQRAAEIQPAPALWYNIGLCHLRLGQLDAAIEALETYLRETDPPDRADVEYMLQQARREREEASRPPEPNPDDDGVQPDTPTSNEREIVVVEAKPHRALIIAGGAALGTGVALGLGGGLGFGLAVGARNESIEEFNRTRGTSGTLEETLQLRDQAHRFETAQFVLIGVGIAVAAGGITALAIGLRRRAQSRGAPSHARTTTRWLELLTEPSIRF